MIHLNPQKTFDENIDELNFPDKTNFSTFLQAKISFQKERELLMFWCLQMGVIF